MLLYLLALNPTDSVYEGFLPAAARLGAEIVVLTDEPDPHHRRHPGLRVVACQVRDHRAVIGALTDLPPADGIFTNSDHLQASAARAAMHFGLPGKDYRVAQRVKDKALLRRHLADAGLDTVWSRELAVDEDPSVLAELDIPSPCVVKPREGVASEDVVLVTRPAELMMRCKEIRQRRPDTALVVEEYLDGPLYTLETLGDGNHRTVLGGFATTLSAPPYFVELRHTFTPAHPEPIVAQVLAQLDALGIGFGCCHTEFVVQYGRARLIEVNYRAIGDHCDLALEQVLGIPLFERVLRVHLGETLPADLGIRHGGAARIDHVCAPASGTLIAAPDSHDSITDGVCLSYRKLRDIGARHEISHTNRDYLGVLRAVGTDSAAVDRAADQFLAAQRWEVVR
ncbi:ATP-grasp domain-containing protein [Nocardia brevicatena]|uniref:ATP-grasp domain-containing protein n=1 Tax=Nocardia brevicatena TaxID=37327 RepID=UPI0002F7191D|nr:ATP-grasp domain-containing protein [Nocardia brevicatena]